MKIYTITCSNAYNYGAVLQAYALQQYLIGNGNVVEIIDYYPPYLRKISEKYRKNYFLRLIRSILYFPDYLMSKRVFEKFKQEYLITTSKCYSKNDIDKLEKADLYIVGSDQVWNPNMENGRDENYFLNFNGINKMSYAASIACYDLIDQYKANFKAYLKDYSLVTVRERQNVQTLKNIGIESEYVLDPVYLLSKTEWKKLCKIEYTEKYVLVYALHHIQEIYNYAKELAKSIDAKVYVINVEIKEKLRGNDKFFWNPDVNTFLSLIDNCEAIVSNSFHGISFGLIFEKPVHIFDTEKNDLRIKNIVEIFNLENRLIDLEYPNILDNSIQVEGQKIIGEEAKRSKQILLNGINEVCKRNE
ncbi:polysaccharide pyruvyl transferase family protein [Candidatus Stoquefichus sp. SB1]|uniref:polysaccharide pyruvyl transferase family protein n=1 Tax=Candidatus Stoquefichus sp. SB1 TaxID=1658109 RepID=UPI00067F1FFB|nr:polysaccharide pyruvyl transferase family protein [Candidatus Stoquefichus sp. SB1]